MPATASVSGRAEEVVADISQIWIKMSSLQPAALSPSHAGQETMPGVNTLTQRSMVMDTRQTVGENIIKSISQRHMSC